MKLYYYEDVAGYWRWRLVSRNGRIIGASSESYTTLQNCKSNYLIVCVYARDEVHYTYRNGVEIG